MRMILLMGYFGGRAWADGVRRRAGGGRTGKNWLWCVLLGGVIFCDLGMLRVALGGKK